MMELTNTKQQKGELIINDINRWKALSLDCNDKLTELSTVEMCTQGIKETKVVRKHDGDEKRRTTLRERQKKLPEFKQPEQVGKVDDLNYCKYHWVISHPVEKCFVLKELILKLAREKKIKLDIDEIAQTNHVVVEMTSSVPPATLLYDQREKEVLEVTACHAISIVEVDNNYASSKEVGNSNEIKQTTSVFNRIKPSTTRSSIFQRLSMATKEEENQYPTFTSTQTSAFKRLCISISKKDRPSTSAFDRLKMTNDQQQKEMKTLKAKSFYEENNDDKIHSHVLSRMKRKLSVDINTEGSLIVKPRLIIFTNPTNEGEGDNVKVAVDVVVDGDCAIPIPSEQGMYKMSQEVGSHIFWPRHLVITDNIEMDYGEFTKDMITFAPTPIQNAPVVLRFLLRMVEHMGYLYTRMESSRTLNLYKFVNAGSISCGSSKKERAQLLTARLLGIDYDQLLLIPYNSRNHWTLVVINHTKGVAFWIDPLKNRIDPDVTKVVERSFNIMKKKKTKLEGREGM
ncbi:retrotransposon gag protein [Cucumis melo var. makuwa]|uniref:Retrotransposon gag protein n=1 Tax=Cucumis melo var. makuwa TaxID=1194695 RepID=A0A5D3E4T1_CUCMM|nr:retrotransposon gag protein [Cucumis melo var. makuwa]TYK30849.1 retrotransposon gag protein [Cucumis melo var. makuwa]